MTQEDITPIVSEKRKDESVENSSIRLERRDVGSLVGCPVRYIRNCELHQFANSHVNIDEYQDNN